MNQFTTIVIFRMAQLDVEKKKKISNTTQKNQKFKTSHPVFTCILTSTFTQHITATHFEYKITKICSSPVKNESMVRAWAEKTKWQINTCKRSFGRVEIFTLFVILDFGLLLFLFMSSTVLFNIIHKFYYIIHLIFQLIFFYTFNKKISVSVK